MTIDQLNRLDVTFEDIQKANASLSTIDLKNKAYTEVNQRIKAFRMLYPQGFITTEIISNQKEENSPYVCIIKATVGFMNADGEKQVLGTGIAYEKENSSFINKTSYIENCETSAVGRALAMCGIGIDTSIASAEEVQTAVLNSETINAEHKKALMKMIQEANISEEYICDIYAVSEIKELTIPKFTNLTTNWKKCVDGFEKWKAANDRKDS